MFYVTYIKKKYIASPKRQLSIAKAFMWPFCVWLILEKDAESKAWILASTSAPCAARLSVVLRQIWQGTAVLNTGHTSRGKTCMDAL